jgi:hypothetical protein
MNRNTQSNLPVQLRSNHMVSALGARRMSPLPAAEFPGHRRSENRVRSHGHLAAAIALSIDRVKAMVFDIENRHLRLGAEIAQQVEQSRRAEKRALQLVRILTIFFLAAGSLVTAGLVFLLGVDLFFPDDPTLRQIALIVGVCAEFTGVLGLVPGCALLIRELRAVDE